MPRAAEFRDAAARFQAMADSLASEVGARRLLTAEGFGLAGPAATEVDARLAEAVDQLTVSSERYTDLARECHRRAAVCDDYADRLQRYRTMSPVEQLLESSPRRPASWADA